MNNQYFKDNQKELLKLINAEAGRELLRIKDEAPILKITPTAYMQLVDFDEKNITLKGRFYMYEKMAKYLMPQFRKREEAYKRLTNPDSLFHFPQVYMTTTDYFTGAGDGYVAINGGGTGTWSSVRDGTTGNEFAYTNTHDDRALGSYANTTNFREFFPADTSGLTSAAVLSAGTLNVSTDTVAPNASPSQADGVVVPTSQSSTSSLANADYNKVTFTQYSDVITPVSASTKYTWTLNPTGLAAVSLTGFTKMGLINYSNDFSNVAPGAAGSKWCEIWMSEHAGGTADPYYEITFTIPKPGFFTFF